MTTTPNAPEFSLFVSSVEGHAVTRFGTRPPSLIGATRTTKPAGNKPHYWSGDSSITWDTKTIVPIPTTEYARYRSEYDGAIAAKSLVRRTREEWDAQMKAHRDAKRAAATTPTDTTADS